MKQTALFKGSVLLLLLTMTGVPALGLRHGASMLRQKALDGRLLTAISRSDTRAVRALLYQGANPNVEFPTYVFASVLDSAPAGSIRQDALGMALNVYNAHKVCPNTDIVTALLEHGALLRHSNRRNVLVHKGVFMSARNHAIQNQDNDFYVDFCYMLTRWKSKPEQQERIGFIASKCQLDRLLRAAVRAGALRY